MDRLRIEHLEEIVSNQTHPCVSIYLPTHLKGADVQQDPIRLKNLVREAERQLNGSVKRDEKDALFEPVRALVDDAPFWRERAPGLALFLGKDVFRYFHVPDPVEERVVVNSHYYIKPLVEWLELEDRFAVLCIGKGGVRFWEGSRTSLTERHVEGMPTRLIEPELGMVGRLPMQGGGTGSIYQGQEFNQLQRESVLRYCRAVDAALHPLLRDERYPMVLAGVDEMTSHFAQVTEYPYLVERTISGNCLDKEANALHHQGWEIVEPRIQRVKRRAMEEYRERVGTGLASQDPHEVLNACVDGRVKTLLLTQGRSVWGVFDREARALKSEPSSNSEDLSDRAALETLMRRGNVYLYPREEFTQETPMGAVFRY